MSCGLSISGRRLINFVHRLTATVGNVKERLKAIYHVPLYRQTLLLGGVVMGDDERTLASYNIGEGKSVELELEVAPITTIDEDGDEVIVEEVEVNLHATQFPFWQKKIRCRETDTVGDFRRLVFDKLTSEGVRTAGMVLYRHRFRGHGVMDVDDHLLSDYLVVDGCVVFMAYDFPADDAFLQMRYGVPIH